jgi:hypothetical protein
MFYKCVGSLVNLADRQIAGAHRVKDNSLVGEPVVTEARWWPKSRHNSRKLEMSANVSASSAARRKTAAPARMPRRLAFAVSLTVLLSGAAVSGGGEDGPMASAPLPPPLPASPPATGLQQPQGGPSPTLPRVLPQSRQPTGNGMQSGHRHKRNNDLHHVNHSARTARGQKRLGQRQPGDVAHRETYTDPRVASDMIPPPAPLPFPYRYTPAAPPAYGYAPVYPPPWAPGPVFPR